MTDTTLEVASDKVLADKALRGDAAAFEELYRRHVNAAWRVAQAVTRNRDDASDAVAEAFARVFSAMRRGVYASDTAFRPYLITAARNAAIDAMRKQGRLQPTEDELDLRDVRATPAERAELAADASFIALAFDGLPERWRSVLWLTEVEGMKPREAAPLLGLSANSTAQLAVRARAGLRQRYLQAHLRETNERECKRTVAHLGAYAAGTLAARDIAKVDQHLAGCEDCRERLAEIQDVGNRLRAIILPLPLGLATAATAQWATAVGSRTGNALALLPGGRNLPPWAQRAVLGGAAAAVAAGVLAATLLNGSDPRPRAALVVPSATTDQPNDDDEPDPPAPKKTGGDTDGPRVGDDRARFGPPTSGDDATDDDSAGHPDDGASRGGDTPSDDDGDNGGGGGGGGGGGSTEGVVEVSVSGTLSGNSGGIAVGVGGGDTGVQLGPIEAGDPPDAPEDDGIEVDLGGSLLGDSIPPIAVP